MSASCPTHTHSLTHTQHTHRRSSGVSLDWDGGKERKRNIVGEEREREGEGEKVGQRRLA